MAAEFFRARKSRSTVALVSTFVGIYLLIWGVIIVASFFDMPWVTVGAVPSIAQLVSLAVFLAAALAVAKDHGTGAVDMVRVLTPTRSRQLIARATALGALGLIAVSVAMILGVIVVLVFNPASLANAALIGAIARMLFVTSLLAWAGVGVGALIRSGSAATFVVLSLIYLLPVAMIITGLSGVGWLAPLTSHTLGYVVDQASLLGEKNWVAVGEVAVWAAALLGLGILRDTKGK